MEQIWNNSSDNHLSQRFQNIEKYQNNNVLEHFI